MRAGWPVVSPSKPPLPISAPSYCPIAPPALSKVPSIRLFCHLPPLWGWPCPSPSPDSPSPTGVRQRACVCALAHMLARAHTGCPHPRLCLQKGPRAALCAQHISHVLECSVSAPLARTESQVLLLELVVRQASAVVLRLHQPRPTAGCPRGHGHGPKEPWPAGLAVRGPGAKVALRGVSPGPLLWTSLEHGAPQPPKPRQATSTPQCPQCPKPPPQAVGPGVPYPGALATEDEASLSQPGAQSRNPSAPGPSLASRSMPALRSRPRE